MIQNYYKTKWYFSFFIISVLTAFLMISQINTNRFNTPDFGVYYKAADRIATGENLYQPDADGFFRFKYSPTSAIYFIPFSLFQYSVAKILYFIFLTITVCTGIFLCFKLIEPNLNFDNGTYINNKIMLGFLILVVHIQDELNLGQVNHLMLVIYISAIYFISVGKKTLSSFVLAGSVFIKPFGLIFLPYFLIKKEYKLFFMFLGSFVFFAVIPVLFYGFEGMINQYQLWFHELSVELSMNQSLMADANNTIFSVIARFTPVAFLELGTIGTRIFQLIILGLMSAIFLSVFKNGKLNPESYKLEMAILICSIPVLVFTSHNAFGFIEMIVFFILLKFKSLPVWAKTVSIIGFIFTGANWYDIMGKQLWRFIENNSFATVGALLLLGIAVFMRYKKIA